MTSNLSPSAQVTNLLLGGFVAHAISAAARLGIPDALRERPRSSLDVASELDLHAPSLYRLLRALATCGIVTESEDSCFSLTPMGECLCTTARDSLGPFATWLGAQWLSVTWSELPYSVRTGKTAFDHVFGRRAFQWMEEHPEEAAIFNAAMGSFTTAALPAISEAYDFSRSRSIIDVGGCHGELLCHMLQTAPTAHGTVFDLPHVVEGAKKTIAKNHLTDRCRTIGGDFFKSVPEGLQVYCIQRVLHDWEDDACVTILKNCVKGMDKDGKVLVIEQVYPNAGIPSPICITDLLMLVGTEGGRERTVKEFEAVFEEAGLRLHRVIPTRSLLSILEALPHS